MSAEDIAEVMVAITGRAIAFERAGQPIKAQQVWALGDRFLDAQATPTHRQEIAA